MTVSSTTTQTKCRRYMSIKAWEALQERDREYALNLAIAGPWIDEDNKERDNYGNLDARYGSERCQETALLCTITISIINDFLDKNNKRSMAVNLVHKYRVAHQNDKRWMDIYELDDISTTNPQGYNALKQEIFNSMNSKLVTYFGWSKTINSFSVLTRNEHGIALKYRRARDVLVATTQEEKDKDMGECCDMDYPLRVLYSQLNFELMEDLATSILPEGTEAIPFAGEPRKCNTFAEQLREVYHFSARYKMVAGQYPIKIGSFSTSFEILLRAAWKHDIPITICMPRLRYSTDETNNTQYQLTSAAVLTYLPSKAAEGCYEFVEDDYLKEHGLDKKASWRMSGFSMYSDETLGNGICSAHDQEFVDQLKKSDIAHLLSIFGFAHMEYPDGVKGEKYETLDLLKAVCPEETKGFTRTLETSNGWSLDSDQTAHCASFLELYNISTPIAEEFDLSNTFIARQRDGTLNACYDMQAKNIPYTFNHIEVSAHEHEQQFWNNMAETHRIGGSTYRHIFIVGNEAYSMANQSTADEMMKIGNETIKIKTLLEAHPQHKTFVRRDHLERYERSVKVNILKTTNKKIFDAAENKRRAEKNKLKKEKRQAKIDLDVSCSRSTLPAITPIVPSVPIVPLMACRSSAMIPIDIPRMVLA